MKKDFCALYIYSDFSKEITFSLEDGEIKPFEHGNCSVTVENTIENFIGLIENRIDFHSVENGLQFWISYERISSIEFYAKPIKRFEDDGE